MQKIEEDNLGQMLTPEERLARRLGSAWMNVEPGSGGVGKDLPKSDTRGQETPRERMPNLPGAFGSGGFSNTPSQSTTPSPIMAGVPSVSRLATPGGGIARKTPMFGRAGGLLGGGMGVPGAVAGNEAAPSDLIQAIIQILDRSGR